RRGVTRSSGSLAFGALPSPPLSALAALSPLSGFGALACSPLGWPPLASPPLACCALSPFSGRGAFSDLSGLPDFSAFLPLVSVSAIDLHSRTLGDPHLAAVIALAHELEADAGRLAVLGIGKRQVGQVHGRLFRDDAALLLRALLLVTLDH